MGCMGVCTANYLDESTLAASYVSSEKVVYPASNLYNLNQRTKVWRTNGAWEIVDGENTIVFREQIGVNITATVPAGSYASTAAFIAAIETALEDVGASGYTVEIVASGKIKITSALSGGAAIFTVMWTLCTDMAVIMGFDEGADSSGAANYTAALLRIHTSESIIWDLGFPTNPKAFILASQRNEPLKISDSAVVKIMGNWTNAWNAPAVELTIALDDFILGEWSDDGLAGADSAGYRYWKLELTDPSNLRQYLEFGLVYLGEMYNPTQGCAVYPLEYSPVDASNVIYAEAGQTFVQELPNTLLAGINWQNLSDDEERTFRQFFERVKKSQSFFLIMDESGAFSNPQTDWVKLVKFRDEPKYNLPSFQSWEAKWNVREEL